MSRKRCPLAVLSLTAGSRATKAHSIGHMMYWQISVTNMSVSDQGGGERNGSKTCVPRLWLITTYALTSHWQSDTVPSRVKTAPTMLIIFDVNVIIYLCDSIREATWTCQSCTYSVDFKEINTTSQSLPSTCAICLQPRQSGRHRVNMMTSSNGNIFRVTGHLCGEFTGPRWIPVNSPHKGQWRGALMFTLICARIKGWVNTREAGDLSRHRAHCDIIVMDWDASTIWNRGFSNTNLDILFPEMYGIKDGHLQNDA